MSPMIPRLIRTAALCCLAGLAHAKPRVLLVEGASDHDWRQRIGILESIISRDATFELDVSIAPETAGDPTWATWSPVFADYDAVILGYRGNNDSPDWPAAVKTSLEAYVSGGGGLLLLHEAPQGFLNWPAFQSMIGLGTDWQSVGTAVEVAANGSLVFHPPGTGGLTDHGQQTDSLVTRLGNHPIHAGLPPSWMAANLEVTRYPCGPAANLTVLSYATDPDPPAGEPAKRWPIEWVVAHGLGRVYASVYGHIWDYEAEPPGLRCVAFQEIFLRALKWCAGTNPPATLPPDFPGTATAALRPYSEGFAAFGGPVPVGPFANGVLPDSSIVPTGYEITPAFPALAWDSPIDARPWPGAPGELLVVEMDGRFFRVPDHDSAGTRQPVLDIRNLAWYLNFEVGSPNTKHGGVLSCAFHPAFGTGAGKDHLYVFYLHHPTNDDPDALPPFYDRLSRFTWNGTAFDPASEQILIQQYDTATGHDGGCLVFDGDGFLNVSFGDEGVPSAQAGPHTQKIDDRPRSGVWRIDVDMTGGAVSHPIRRQRRHAPTRRTSRSPRTTTSLVTTRGSTPATTPPSTPRRTRSRSSTRSACARPTG